MRASTRVGSFASRWRCCPPFESEDGMDSSCRQPAFYEECRVGEIAGRNRFRVGVPDNAHESFVKLVGEQHLAAQAAELLCCQRDAQAQTGRAPAPTHA